MPRVSSVTEKEQIYQINPSRPVHVVTVWCIAIKIYIRISINIYLQCARTSQEYRRCFEFPACILMMNSLGTAKNRGEYILDLRRMALDLQQCN